MTKEFDAQDMLNAIIKKAVRANPCPGCASPPCRLLVEILTTAGYEFHGYDDEHEPIWKEGVKS